MLEHHQELLAAWLSLLEKDVSKVSCIVVQITNGRFKLSWEIKIGHWRAAKQNTAKIDSRKEGMMQCKWQIAEWKTKIS